MKITLAEKQLISTLNWFRSHYALYQGLDQDRPSTKKAIEQFGKDWIGRFKEDWELAFTSLLQKGILLETNGTFDFTEKGKTIKDEVEEVLSFYQLEYDNFYDQSEKSESHKSFCKAVYGINLSQHGLIDQEELQFLIKALKKRKPGKVLDLGCGNGSITAHLQQQIPASSFIGVDISQRGIDYAREHFAGPGLSFERRNMNALNLEDNFDTIISLDTLYYVKDIGTVLQACKNAATKGGKLLTYFSQWIMGPEYASYLNPDQTKLALFCRELNLAFEVSNLTASGLQHWKLKEQVLLDMKKDFKEEGFENLWDYRYREAKRYANWGDDKYARYFYEISL